MFLFKFIFFTFLPLLCLVDGFHHTDMLMKAALHGASMGMMMRGPSRMIPIPIPISTDVIKDIFSGFRKQFDGPKVVVVQNPNPEPKIVIINLADNNNHPQFY